jgi:hypothetical protein
MDTLWVFQASTDELEQRLCELKAAADGRARCAAFQAMLELVLCQSIRSCSCTHVHL